MISDLTHPSFLLIAAAIVTAVLNFMRGVFWAIVLLLVDLVCMSARIAVSRTIHTTNSRTEPLQSDDR